MAVRHGYGKIAGADALVFAYDTGDNRNSYKGEPTTNLITHVLPNSNWNTNGSGVIITQNYGYDHNGVLRSSKIMDNPNSGNSSFAYTSAFSVSAGTYTFSAMVKTSSANASSNSFMELYNMDPVTYLGQTSFAGITPGVWTKVSVTGTLASGTTHIAPHFYSLPGDGTNFIEVVDVQLEQKSHATPFAGALGTRSSTQGLLDLTGNKTIDLSNVSFDSNAQMFFDGTDDYIDIPNSTTLFSGTQDFTVEAAYNMEGQGGGAILVNYGPGYTTNHLWFSGQYGIWLDGGVYAPGAPLSNGRYHMVGTRESGVMKLYLNGVLVNSGTRSNSIATDINYRIGADVSSPNEEFTGDIYVVKAYSRALTAAEVRSNYNFYKSRFNL